MKRTHNQLRRFAPAIIFSAAILLPINALAAPNPPQYVNPYNSNSLISNYNYSGLHAYAGVNYQQFSNNGSTFAESSTGKSYNVSPNYHAGYNLGIGYLIPNRNTDFALSYSYLHTSDSSNAWAPSLTLSPTGLGPVSWASSSLTFNYNTVDLTAGHRFQLDNTFDINLYGGLNYTHLSRDMSTYGEGLGNEIRVSVGSSYNGYGPTFGVDGYCHPSASSPNFSIVGGLKPTVLYGTMSGYVNTNVNDVRLSDNIPNEKIVVPAIGAKLGLNYDLSYRKTDFNFQLGYQATTYFGVTKDSTYNNTTNASLQGVYFNVGFRF